MSYHDGIGYSQSNDTRGSIAEDTRRYTAYWGSKYNNGTQIVLKEWKLFITIIIKVYYNILFTLQTIWCNVK